MVDTDPSFDIELERRRGAAMRTYTTPAVITLRLYWVFWLPGFIANLVYWQQAARDEQLIGRAPDGKGCLLWRFIVFTMFVAAGS
ncbi:MAG: hypothetical protein QJR03_09225 [Sphaerobacter sp.]|nr:hypothetical protein [Sphaerobacter sp.]